MNACLDIQSALGRPTGVGRYARLLAEHLPAAVGGDDLSLFCFDFRNRGIPFDSAAPARRIRWLPGRAAQGAWKHLRWPPFDWFSGSADVFHFPNFTAPPLSRGRCVVTVHDAAWLRLPDTLEPKNLRWLTRRMPDTLRRADAVLTVSRFTADELAACTDTPREKIVPIHSGFGWSAPPFDPDLAARVRRDHGLDRPWILGVGTLEPRKNWTLIADLLERADSYDGLAVIAGARGWKDEPILERLRTSPAADRIRVLTDVGDRALAALYAGAAAFVFPSLYEGFGFPPLEAMARGIPVLSSTGGSLPEVLGDAALFADPRDPDAWVDALPRILGDSARRADLIRRGKERAAAFAWEQTARQTMSLYREVAAR
jgi:glycosyltransferase involved in cell wall biosynthesis